MISSVTETFQNIATEDSRIWAGCENIYNLYDSGTETDFFISRDRINHLIVAHVTRDADFDTVLACQDSCIRIIHGSNLFLEIPTDAAVTAVAFMEIDSDATGMKAPTALVYGLATGELCLVQVFSNGEYTHIWKVEDNEQRSPITSICVYDLDGDRRMEMVVGRDDGRVEVHKQQPDSLFAVPYKVFDKDIGEFICLHYISNGYGTVVNITDFSFVYVYVCIWAADRRERPVNRMRGGQHCRLQGDPDRVLLRQGDLLHH